MATNILEAHVRRVACMMHAHQMARLYKIPNDIKIVDGQPIYAEQTPADFMGFTITGRVIVLECKMRKGPSLALGPQGLKAHQRIAINEAHKAGGIGLLAWMNDNEVAVIDADQVRRYGSGRRSIAWKDIPRGYLHPLNEDPLRFFWPFISGSGSRES